MMHEYFVSNFDVFLNLISYLGSRDPLSEVYYFVVEFTTILFESLQSSSKVNGVFTHLL